MSNPKPETGPGKSAPPHQGTAADTSASTRHAHSRTPVRLAFYGRTNQRGRAAQTELAFQLGLCRAILGHQAVITRTHYDIPELAATLPGFTSIDAGGLPHAGGWDELAAAMDADPSRRDFEAVICTTADRISRRLPVLQAREEFARRCGTPILCTDELTTPEQYRSIARQLRRSPFSTPAPDAQAHRLRIGPCEQPPVRR